MKIDEDRHITKNGQIKMNPHKRVYTWKWIVYNVSVPEEKRPIPHEWVLSYIKEGRQIEKPVFRSLAEQIQVQKHSSVYEVQYFPHSIKIIKKVIV